MFNLKFIKNMNTDINDNNVYKNNKGNIDSINMIKTIKNINTHRVDNTVKMYNNDTDNINLINMKNSVDLPILITAIHNLNVLLVKRTDLGINPNNTCMLLLKSLYSFFELLIKYINTNLQKLPINIGKM